MLARLGTLARPRRASNVTTVLLLAHPNLAASRVNRALVDGLRDLPGLEIADLYALYPAGQIDFAIERARVLRADRLVLQFPLYWYSTPPLLKHWQDAVLTPLFYLEPDVAASTVGLPVIAATTTGGPPASYALGDPAVTTIDALFAPLKATARRCGWSWQVPFAVHDVRNIDDAALAVAREDYRSLVLAAPIRASRSSLAASREGTMSGVTVMTGA